MRGEGVGHGKDAWAAFREKLDDYSREALQAAHLEIETVKMRSNEDPDEFLYKRDRCRNHLNSLILKKGSSDNQ